MATYHIAINRGVKGAAVEHSRYMRRDGRFTVARYGVVIASGCANFPIWCCEDPHAFWHASDRFERANGSSYREYELALPCELANAEWVSLVRRFAEEQFGAVRAYQWAIYQPQGADGLTRPQARVMFSDRQLDGIERGPEQFFMRYNSKAPHRGGARKFKYGTKLQAAQVYRAIRARWALVQNEALAAAGLDARVDHRSLRDQGILDRASDRHRGRIVNAIESRGEISYVGQDKRKDHVQGLANLKLEHDLLAQLAALDREEQQLMSDYDAETQHLQAELLALSHEAGPPESKNGSPSV